MPFVPAPGAIPPAWVNADQQVIDVGAINGTDGARQPAALRNDAAGEVARRLDRPGLARRLLVRGEGAQRLQAGAVGLLLADDRGGDPTAPLGFGLPGGTISDLDGARIRQAVAGSGGRGRFRITADEYGEVATSWPGVPTSSPRPASRPSTTS